MASSAHVGKAGHLAVMSEFLLRGYNVAMPEVDLGDDIFVVEDATGELWRIQVKTAIGVRQSTGWRAKYSVKWEQLTNKVNPDLYFVFAVRCGSAWEFLPLARPYLKSQRDSHDVGSLSGGNLLLTITFQGGGFCAAGKTGKPRETTGAFGPSSTDFR